MSSTPHSEPLTPPSTQPLHTPCLTTPHSMPPHRIPYHYSAHRTSLSAPQRHPLLAPGQPPYTPYQSLRASLIIYQPAVRSPSAWPCRPCPRLLLSCPRILVSSLTSSSAVLVTSSADPTSFSSALASSPASSRPPQMTSSPRPPSASPLLLSGESAVRSRYGQHGDPSRLHRGLHMPTLGDIGSCW